MELLGRIEEAAARAGGILLEYQRSGVSVDHKSGHELVTSADMASERFLRETLHLLLPGSSFIGEESWDGAIPGSPFWVVDPLDGTNNYASSYPVFSVSIALVEDDEVTLGCVYDPLRRESFTAARGKGTRLNGQPVSASAASSLGDVLLATGFPYGRTPGDPGADLDVLGHFLGYALGIRRGGSAALDLAYTACGRLGGFWEEHLNPWDMAAGVLLVREAGGMCSGYDLGEWSLLSEGVIAAGPGLFSEVSGAIGRHNRKRGAEAPL
jgi:myo-inositol-1(or 4)-monophosphatase